MYKNVQKCNPNVTPMYIWKCTKMFSKKKCYPNVQKCIQNVTQMYIFVHQDQGVPKGGTMYINQHYPFAAVICYPFYFTLFLCYYYQYLVAIHQSTSQWT